MDEMLDPEMARLRAMRVADLIDRVQSLHRRRGGEVGQGCKDRGHQAPSEAASEGWIFRNVRSAKSGCLAARLQCPRYRRS